MADGAERENTEGISIDEFMGVSDDRLADGADEGDLDNTFIEGAIDDIFNIEDIDLDDISLSDLLVDDFDDDSDYAMQDEGELHIEAPDINEEAAEPVSGEDPAGPGQEVSGERLMQPDGMQFDLDIEQPEDVQTDSDIEQPEDVQPAPDSEQPDDMQPAVEQEQPVVADNMQAEAESDVSGEPMQQESTEDTIRDVADEPQEDVQPDVDAGESSDSELLLDEDIDEDIDLMQLLIGGDEDDDFELIDDEPPQQQTQESQVKEDASVNDGDSEPKKKQKKDSIFSDPLSVLSDDDEENVDVDDVGEILDKVKADSKKNKKKKEKKEKKAGKGIGKIFSNVVDEKEIKKVEQEKKEAELAAKKKDAEEEKKQQQAEEKAAKKEEKKLAKAQLSEEKKREKEAKKKAKKEAREQRRKEEETEIEGRINKVGAAIVFALIGGMAIFLYVGTKKFSYNSSISNAKSYFESGRYEESYNELAGAELKEEDLSLYNKAVTIMHVYKQLDAYETYYKNKKYPQALDSLLKGMREYDKYMPDAIEYDVTDSLDSIKNQIIVELSAEYSITEEMAREINSLTDSTEYSKRVYELAQNLSSNYYSSGQ